MDTMKAIARRSSTRSYTAQQLSADDVQAILSAGYAAPVAMGRYEDLHYTVIQNKDILSRLTIIIRGAARSEKEPFYEAPTLIVISTKEPISEGLDCVNAGCAVENMLLAATDRGIGSVIVWSSALAIEADAEIKKALSIPNEYTARLGACFGYSAEEISDESTQETTVETNWV